MNRPVQLRSALRTAVALVCLGLLSPAAIAEPYSAPIAASVAGLGIAGASLSGGSHAAIRRTGESRECAAPKRRHATPLLRTSCTLPRNPTSVTEHFVLIEDVYLRNAVLLR